MQRGINLESLLYKIMKTVSYYRLQKGSEFFDLYQSREDAEENLGNCLHFIEEEKHLWKVKEFSSSVQEIPGSLENWGESEEELWHVSWKCPTCDNRHHTDLEQDQVLSSPALWFCEYKDFLFLVYWKKP